MKLKYDKLLSRFAFNFNLRPDAQARPRELSRGVWSDQPESGAQEVGTRGHCPPRHRPPTRSLNPRFSSQLPSYDVASNVCVALRRGGSVGAVTPHSAALYGMFDAHALAARLHSSPYIRLLCTDAEALPRDPTALSFWVHPYYTPYTPLLHRYYTLIHP